jgi:hypothetical protein
MSEFEIRRTRVTVDETRHVAGKPADGRPLRKVAACAVVHNPFAGAGFVEDLAEIVQASESIGALLGGLCQDALDDGAESYGKAGLVGTAGEQEHVHAALTSVFGDPFRAAIGGATAWIPSTKKIAVPGTTIDVPLACKEEVWVRSHYDTISVLVPDGPLPDEMVIIAAVANRGRLHQRVGGKTRDEVLAEQRRG